MKKKDNVAQKNYRMRTAMVDGNYDSKHWEYDHHLVPPISSSVAYRLSSVHRGEEGFRHFGEAVDLQNEPIFVYDRLDEPLSGMLEEKLAYAESGDMAVTFATGMAAISAALSALTRQGDEIVAHNTLYGCTYSLLSHWLPKHGIQTKFVDLKSREQLLSAITSRTRVVYLETPVNPTLDIIDIGAIKDGISKANATKSEDEKIVIIVDNTFATPFCQRPLTLGADIVVHSLTKNIAGFGTDMGGAVIAASKYQRDLLLYRKDFGGVLAPRSAWPILVYGLPTLAARMVNQQKSAIHIARFLEKHPLVKRVLYPGLKSFPQKQLAELQMVSYDGRFAPGSILYFELKADTSTEGEKTAEFFIDDVARTSRCINLAVSLGQVRTLIEAPYSMTHSALPADFKDSIGISPSGIRLSLGLEDWHDIEADLKSSLDRTETMLKFDFHATDPCS